MPDIPRVGAVHSAREVRSDPYRFISRCCADFGTDVFETRLSRFRAICMTGQEAARTFYDTGNIQRAGAAPARLLKTVFGQDGVQTLDGEQHACRKELFNSLLDTERVSALAASFASTWRGRAQEWATRDHVVLYDELLALLTRTVCDWAGVPLPDHHLARRSRDLAALFDGAGAIGPRHWRARRARSSTNRWMEDVVAAIRTRELQPQEGSAAHVVAWHMDPDHGLLNRRVAAVELLNILRPTVAVAVYITFVAHALHENPHCRHMLESGDDRAVEMFVAEVRRSYPFFPAVVGLSEGFDFHDYRVPAGSPVVLDLHGTNHDSRVWDEPERFNPERFRTGHAGEYGFVPQGGGDPRTHHRCPGEPVATELMKVAVAILGNELDYDLPEQDLRIDYARLPALPRSRMLLRGVRSHV